MAVRKKKHSNIYSDNPEFLAVFRKIAKNVKAIRKKYGYTQSRFGEEVLQSASNINALISNKECVRLEPRGYCYYYTLLDLLLISKEFNISLTELIEGDIE